MIKSLFEISKAIEEKEKLKFMDPRIPEDFRNKKIIRFDVLRPFVAGGYYLKVEGNEDGIRIGGNGNTMYPQSLFQSVMVEVC